MPRDNRIPCSAALETPLAIPIYGWSLFFFAPDKKGESAAAPRFLPSPLALSFCAFLILLAQGLRVDTAATANRILNSYRGDGCIVGLATDFSASRYTKTFKGILRYMDSFHVNEIFIG